MCNLRTDKSSLLHKSFFFPPLIKVFFTPIPCILTKKALTLFFFFFHKKRETRMRLYSIYKQVKDKMIIYNMLVIII